MPSVEILKKVKNLLQKSADKFKIDYLELDDYSVEAVATVFESIADVCERAAKAVKEDEFKTPTDALDFSATIVECLLNTLVVNLKSFSILKEIIRSKN